MALKVRTMKLDDATWERWQARAAVASTSVAALIIASMDGAVTKDAEIAALQADVAALKRELAKRSVLVVGKPIPPSGGSSSPREAAPPVSSAEKPKTDAEREYIRKVLTGAINPKNGKQA